MTLLKLKKYLPKAVLACCGLILSGVTLKAANADGMGKLYGLVHWDGKQTTNKGLAIIPTDSKDWKGQLSYLWKVAGYPYNYGGTHFEDKYFCTFLRIMDGYILEQYAYIFDDQTGEELDKIHLPTAFDLYDGCYYEPEETIYAFVKDMSTSSLGWAKINPRTAAMQMVKRYTGLELYGVVVTDEGLAYGISGDGGLYSIDRATGDTQLIFSHDDLATKTVPKAHTGAAWDEENKRIVFAVCNLDKDGGSRLFSVDPARKSVDLIYKLDGLGTQLAGLYFEQVVQPLAPGSPIDLAVNFASGALTGSLKFKLPTTSYNGTMLTGNVDYIVKVDGEKVSEGSGSYGQQLEVPVTVKEAGWHTFHVRCSNESGNGYSAKLETFVGYEAPLAPSNVSARHYGGKMHLTWDPSPTTGAKGGPVNVDEIQYVIKTNDGQTFTTEAGATAYEYALAVPEVFTPWYCSITAKNEDGTSQPAASNNVPLGVVGDEYIQNFSTEASKYHFTILDSNKDGITWGWNQEQLMAIRYNEQLAMDDYLTLPPMNMEYGDYYAMEFDAGVFNFEERLEVKLSYDYNQSGMDSGETVYGPVTIPVKESMQESWDHQSFVMQSPDDSKFFLSIHGISAPDMNVLLIDNIHVRKLAGGTVPAAVTALKATADANGALKVKLTGTLPTKDVAGNPVSSVDYVKIMRGGRLLATVDVSGQTSFTWTDENAAKGDNEYVVMTGNSTGDGLTARCTAFTGFVTPKTPLDCVISYTGNDYSGISFSWSPVTEDLNNRNISEVVTYDVIRSIDGDLSYKAMGQKATSITDDFKSIRNTVFVQYGAYAVVDGQDGDMIVSDQVPVGPACSLPLAEGFYPEIKMPYGIDLYLTTDDSGLYTTYDTDKYQSPDGDGGYGVFIGNASGESATLYTAWLTIPKDAKEPVASIQYFGEGDAISNLIHIGVSTDLADGFKLAESVETGGMGWQTAEIPLDRYRGQDIRIALKFETVRNTYLRFDDFRVYDKNPTGVGDIMADGEFSVTSGAGYLNVTTPEGAMVQIHRIDGMKIYNGEGNITINVTPGIYIVSDGKRSIKVIVK